MTTQQTQILSQIKQSILAIDNNADVLLFGSRARGDFKEDSDWDILVLTENLVDNNLKRNISDNLFYLELDNAIAISTVIVNKKNWADNFKGYPLFFEVKKDGFYI
ncbi:MAG: nucleotidyltransferase domain-containing protein [Deinococcales bacterium]|nr:nucleotidyltransferase domain-containing protein [Chitinophagaceae bacterium]